MYTLRWTDAAPSAWLIALATAVAVVWGCGGDANENVTPEDAGAGDGSGAIDAGEADGSGTDPCPAGAELRIEPSSIALSVVDAPVEISINNGGTAVACLADPFAGLEPLDAPLLVTGTPPATLAPGETTTMTIAVDPAARGRRLAAVVFQSTNGGGARLTVDYQGGTLAPDDVNGPEDLAPGEAFVFVHTPWGAREVFVTRDAGFITGEEGASIQFRAEGFDLDLGMPGLFSGLPFTSASLEWEVSRQVEYEPTFDAEQPRLQFETGRDGRITGQLVNPPLELPLSAGAIAIWEMYFVKLPCLDCEVCDNGSDDDGDLDIDCLDLDCQWDITCADYFEQNCTDSIDNDGDGLLDCDDDNCLGEYGCIEIDCTNGFDDDGDGLIDCQDPGPYGAPECSAHPDCAETMCEDGVDNDGDGYTDCFDTQCWPWFGNSFDQSATPASCKETACDDGIDNNGNGLVDCDDWDACQADPACGEQATCPSVDAGDIGIRYGNINGGWSRYVESPTLIDEIDSSCGPAGVPEFTVRWTVPEDGDYTISVTTGVEAQTLYVLRGGCDGEEVACQQWDFPVIAFIAGLRLDDLVAGDEYTIVSETAAARGGQVSISQYCDTTADCPTAQECQVFDAPIFGMTGTNYCRPTFCNDGCPEGYVCAGAYNACIPIPDDE